MSESAIETKCVATKELVGCFYITGIMSAKSMVTKGILQLGNAFHVYCQPDCFSEAQSSVLRLHLGLVK